MKKMIAALTVAMILVACSGNKANDTEANLDSTNSTPEAVISTLDEKVQSGDATAIAAAMKTVQNELKAIIKKGDMEKASSYANSIKASLEENAQKAKSFDNFEIDEIISTNINEISNAIKVITLCKEQQVLQRAGYIFLNLPDHKDLDDVDKSVFSLSFGEVLEKAFAYEKKLEEEGYIDMEDVYYWYSGQDYDADDGLQGLSLLNADEKTAIVKVRYKTFGHIDVHEMKLVSSDGQWYCDNWDNMKENLQKGMKAFE